MTLQLSNGALSMSGGALATSVGTQINTVDSFEDGNLDEYQGDGDIGGRYTVVDESSLAFSALDGTQLLEIGTGDTGRIYSKPIDGLPNYFEKGQEITFGVRQQGGLGDDFRFLFGYVDTDNYWDTVMTFDATGDGSFEAHELTGGGGGNYERVDSATVSYSQNSWYELSILRDDGTNGYPDGEKVITLRDGIGGSEMATLRFNSDQFENEAGIAWRGYLNSFPIYVDDARLTIQ